MRTFAVTVRPSRVLWAASCLFYAAAFAACLTCFYGRPRLFGLTALTLAAAYTWRVQTLRHMDRVDKIGIEADGGAVVVLPNRQKAVSAVLLPDSLIHRRICLLHWQTETRSFWQCLPADAAEDGGQYRRLLVWARFGQPKITGMRPKRGYFARLRFNTRGRT